MNLAYVICWRPTAVLSRRLLPPIQLLLYFGNIHLGTYVKSIQLQPNPKGLLSLRL
jgi:hypothetical protein